jgi:hypothetical protein
MNSKLPRLTYFLVTLAAFTLAPILRVATAASDEPVNETGPSAAATQASPYSANLAAGAPRSLIAAAEPKTVGDQLMAQVGAQLERRESVSARLRYQLFLGGQPLYGLGSYWQKGTGDELRVRLELQIAGQEANLLQVSNSRFLWIERRLPVGLMVTRLDLRQLRADAAASESRLGEIQPGNASWTSSPPELIAYSGGLPSLLTSLNERFTFLPPQTMRLASKSETGQQTSSIPFFAVVGHWRKDKLLKLIASDATSNTQQSVPARLPEEVLILVGQADLFPYRLEYRKLETPPAANRAGSAAPFQLSGNPMVVLEFTDIAFDVQTDPGQFNYTPGNAEWTDRTAAVLERLRLSRDQQIAERPATQESPARR